MANNNLHKNRAVKCALRGEGKRVTGDERRVMGDG